MQLSTTSSTTGVSCGCLLAVLALNLTIGGMCFDYVLGCTFGKDIPWYGDAAAGLVLGELAIPICWIVRLCGVDVPFFA